MTDYDHLAPTPPRRGQDVDAVEAALGALAIETPSWGYGDSGTRFATFQQPGRPRDVFERLDDAAEVHRLTGTASSVALHFPWDAVDDLAALREHADRQRAADRRREPEPVPGPRLQARLGHPPGRRRARARRSSTCSSAWRSRASSAPPRSRCGSPTAPTTPARTTSRRAAARLLDSLGELYAALPPASRSCCVEYKLFEPAFYATDLADWGSSLLVCQKLGERATRARRPRPPRSGREHRADRRAAGARGPPRRLPLQQPQVRRRRPRSSARSTRSSCS